MPHLSFWIYSTFLNTMSSSSFHFTGCARISLFWAEQYSTLSIYCVFFTHSSLGRHVGSMDILAIENRAVTHMDMQITSLYVDFVSSESMPRYFFRFFAIFKLMVLVLFLGSFIYSQY